MRAILTCVEYGDYLSLTLPYNRHHFEDVMVVTTAEDTETQSIASRHNAQCFITDAFHRDGSFFNKWLALEEGLDAFGRHGILAIMDADILWPKRIIHQYDRGKLYTPFRRVCAHLKRGRVPLESSWPIYKLKPDKEWIGYTQIFHADDPHLPEPPWHETDWLYAAGADSTFQRNWTNGCKSRPSWKVLHLGPTSRNWCGRITNRLDGNRPSDFAARTARFRQAMRNHMALKRKRLER